MLVDVAHWVVSHKTKCYSVQQTAIFLTGKIIFQQTSFTILHPFSKVWMAFLQTTLCMPLFTSELLWYYCSSQQVPTGRVATSIQPKNPSFQSHSSENHVHTVCTGSAHTHTHTGRQEGQASQSFHSVWMNGTCLLKSCNCQILAQSVWFDCCQVVKRISTNVTKMLLK